MSEMLSFLRAIADEPDDDTCRLVFADWLEEHGDWRAEFFRLDCRLKQLTTDDEGYNDLKGRWDELWARLTPAWRAVVGRSPIENCPLSFKFRCPMQWEKLLRTEVAAVRFCDSCRKKVYYCGSIDEAREHAVAGHCVAVDVAVARWPGDLSDEGLVLGALAINDLDELEDG
jgi:uncharacterized protein (TIGR02996 family)